MKYLRAYKNIWNPAKGNTGFSIVELLVAMAVAGVLMAAIFKAYDSQNEAHKLQQQILEAQQNIRAAAYVLERDLRMAGYTGGDDDIPNNFDTNPISSSLIVDADQDALMFAYLDDNEGDRTVTPPDLGRLRVVTYYTLADGDTLTLYRRSRDTDLQGDTESEQDFRARLPTLATVKGDPQDTEIVAENIEAVNFVYRDNDGDALNNVGDIDLQQSDFDNVESVEVTLVVRSEMPLRGEPEAKNYENQEGHQILSTYDRFRRRMISKHIFCRNLTGKFDS